LDRVRTTGGDFNEGDLAAVVDCPERNQFVVSKFLEHAKDRKAIAFTVTIDHAKHLVEAFQAQGIKADWVAGDSPDRAEKLSRFRQGETQVLASCMVLSEGYDETSVDCILLCRPTKSRALFSQQCGRGLRLHSGKSDCLILDFVDASGKHRLVSVWKWMGYTRPPKEEDERLELGGEKQKRESRVIAVDADREINLLLPPPDAPIGFDYGQHAWHFEPPTEKQQAFLVSLGYDMNNDYSRGQASAIISAQPPSIAQMRLLANLGYDTSQPWTRGQASIAFEESRNKAEASLSKIRKAGFKVSAVGSILHIEPRERLRPDQIDWISRHTSGLLMALRE
jgi:superfamily II DNA or RNA helicase